MKELYYCRSTIALKKPFQLQIDEAVNCLEDAYKLVLRALKNLGKRPVAWKLGGTTLSTQKKFFVTRPFWGPLFPDQIFYEPKTLMLPNKDWMCAEAEISLRLDEGFSCKKVRQANSSTDINDFFDAWAICVELPYTHILNIVDFDLPVLISDWCASGSLVLGEHHPIETLEPTLTDAPELYLKTYGDDRIEADFTNLCGTPQECAARFLYEAVKTGFEPKPGDWIATGGLTTCVKMKGLSFLEVVFNKHSVISVHF